MEVSEQWKKILLFSLGTIVGLVMFFVLGVIVRPIPCAFSGNGGEINTFLFIIHLIRYLLPLILLILFEIMLYFTITRYSKVMFILLIVMIILVIFLGILVATNINQCEDYYYYHINTRINEQIEQQVLDDLRTGDQKLVFENLKITLNKKDSYDYDAIGIKNTKQGILNYTIQINQIGGDKIFGDKINDNFLYKADGILQSSEGKVIANQIISEDSVGTGQFEIIVKDVTNGEPGVVYDSKTFFITVN